MNNRTAGAPNIVLILLDDIGFADTSTFGGLAQTPELDKLAARGLRYVHFNTTGLCSPTRAALLSGRNHHRVGFGSLTESVSEHSGYNCIWRKSTASIPEVLRRNGYATAAFGKWHNTPYAEVSPLGPFDRWPTRLGFDYFYGFLAGMENQWEPSQLCRGTTPVEAPDAWEKGYHLTTNLTEEAMAWLHTHEAMAPEKPYFLYFAPGAVHEPHHVAPEWIERYAGAFDGGWDELNREIFARQKALGVIPPHTELTPRPAAIPSWNTLTSDQKRLYTRQMEVYAGFIAHTDFEVGRLITTVQARHDADDTLILYIVGDNGSSAVGGVDGFTDAYASVEDQLSQIARLGSPEFSHNIYAAGWAWLGGTPFKWWKGIASHFGGVRDPLVVSWPARIRDWGGLRGQFTHVNDVAATLYDAAGIEFPDTVDGVGQLPLDGVSFTHTFDDANAPSRHRTQYFETVGNRAIYHDGWIAAAAHRPVRWEMKEDFDFSMDRWELYHVEKDFSEANDVAHRFPQKLKKLQELFDSEARKNDIFPLGGGATLTFPTDESSPRAHRTEFVFNPGTPRIQVCSLPLLLGRPFRVTVEAVIPDTGAEGVLLSYGGRVGGFSLYLRNRRLVYEHNASNRIHHVVTSDVDVPSGQVTMALAFTLGAVRADERGHRSNDAAVRGGRLYINDQLVGEAHFPDAAPVDVCYESLGIGRAFGSPVSHTFRPPFAFTGKLMRVQLILE